MLNELSAKNCPHARLASPVRFEMLFKSRQVCDVAVVDVVSGQQAVTLRADVTDLELHISGEFALHRQVVLGGVLRTQVRLKISEQFDRLVKSPSPAPCQGSE